MCLISVDLHSLSVCGIKPLYSIYDIAHPSFLSTEHLPMNVKPDLPLPVRE
ncbi:hypothetical protein GDO78_014692 [Eleutherodactylus coqui]|uniref:Uncharacterized protein n=1 Tax=Eleutherodactylus coqui TaxID=57060 RepID=A0A8J6B6D7_ELECQ|nr:hypothetical protein GDO78_014692 [Eleutherodactylus coqui]